MCEKPFPDFASLHPGYTLRQPFGDDWQPIRHRVCSESQLRNTIGAFTEFVVVLFGLAALAVAAAVMLALMPAVVQFDPQSCRHCEK
jgi:hypothetical protein